MHQNKLEHPKCSFSQSVNQSSVGQSVNRSIGQSGVSDGYPRSNRVSEREIEKARANICLSELVRKTGKQLVRIAYRELLQSRS